MPDGALPAPAGFAEGPWRWRLRSDDAGLCTGIPVDSQIQNDAFGGLGAADEDVAFGWWFDRIR
jgi:hypothetical protein